MIDLSTMGGGLWRSLVARLVRDEEAAGSNPVSPTHRSSRSPAWGPGAPVVWHPATMADREQPDDGPSLQMPSFSLRRRAYAVRLPGVVAALVVGLVVGLGAVLLGWVLGAGCEAVRGTSACGGTIGLPALLAGLVLLTWVGALLLRLMGVADAGSTSLLAVGIAAVVVLVLLLDVLDQGWAVIALPLVGAVAYAVSWWVTAVVAVPAGDLSGRRR